MADGRVEQTGVEAMRALYRAMPDSVDAIGLRSARAASNAMAVQMRARLQNPTPALKGEKHATGATAAAIEIVEDPDNRAVLVHSPSPARYPANLVLWREFGTTKQPARPYAHPAARAVAPQYERDFAAGMDGLCREMSS